MADQYDLVVIGSGPGGQRAAIQAAKLGKRVAVVEKSDQLGGAGLRAGTIPSKALREAALILTGMAGTRLLAGHRPVRRDVTIGELAAVVRDIIAAQLRVVEDAFARNRVTMLRGRAQFVDPHTIVIDGEDGARTVTVDRIVIAVGTRPALPPHVPFNDRTIFTTDTLRYLTQLPQSFLVVGGGVIGTELACTLSALGVQVTLVEGRAELLGFVDREIIEAFQTSIRRQGITLRLVG